jgi:predicted methyltransferase
VADEPFSEFSESLLTGAERHAWQQPREVVRMLSIRSGERVAEIGAARGFFTEQLAARVGEGGRAYAIETDPEMISILEEMLARYGDSRGEVVKATEDDLALPGDLDMVFTANTWHHIKDRNAKREAVQASLKPGGRFVIIDWRTEECSFAPPVDHRLARKDLIAEMEADGWKLTTDARLLQYQYFLVFTPPRN